MIAVSVICCMPEAIRPVMVMIPGESTVCCVAIRVIIMSVIHRMPKAVRAIVLVVSGERAILHIAIVVVCVTVAVVVRGVALAVVIMQPCQSTASNGTDSVAHRF